MTETNSPTTDIEKAIQEAGNTRDALNIALAKLKVANDKIDDLERELRRYRYGEEQYFSLGGAY